MGGDVKALTQTLRHFDRVFIVTPGHEDRTRLAVNALEACKDAMVEFTLVLSVATAHTKTVFGRQFKPIEEAAAHGLQRYAMVRLPLFIDNLQGSAKSIKENATFYDPRNAYKPHSTVAVADVGKAAADILAKPKKHVGQTYTLVMPSFTLVDLSIALTKALGKQILMTAVSYENAKKAFVGTGFPEWQVDGIMEMYHSIDAGKPETN